MNRSWDPAEESIELCRKLIATPEQWEVLQALNYLELKITDCLNEVGVADWDDKILGVKDFSFIEKVCVLYALGYIEKSVAESLKKFSELRNKIAHKYKYVLMDEEQSNFIKEVSKKYNKEDATEMFGELFDEIAWHSDEVKEDDENLVRVSGFHGRPALSRAFALAWWQLCWELQALLDDLVKRKRERISGD